MNAPTQLTAIQIAELLSLPAPTPEQQKVIEADLTPALVVAGAGSGKTETMAARVVWLVANGLAAPEQVLGLTFTRKAAGELEQRIRLRLRHLVRSAARARVQLPGQQLLQGDNATGGFADLVRPTVSTYHAYAAGLLGDHGLRLGIEPTARLLGEAAQYQLVSRLVESWPHDLDMDQSTSTIVAAVLSLSGALAEHLQTPDQAATIVEALANDFSPPLPGAVRAPVRDLVASLYARQRLLALVNAYQETKRKISAIDYGDQVALAAQIARQVEQVGVIERERYPVVLLDEYQDTSYAQVELLASLFGGGHAVTAVGDPHQSIYGWRGASAGGLTRFPRRFPQKNGEPALLHTLSTSWRNDTAILAAANRTATPLRETSLVPVPPLQARPAPGPGLVQALVATTIVDEAQQIAALLVAQRKLDPTATCAVLCRRRSQFALIAQTLVDAGLPVQVVGLGGLLSSPEIVDLVAALQTAYDPSRADAAMRLLTGARTSLGMSDLHALAEWAQELAGQNDMSEAVDRISVVDALEDLPPADWSSKRGRRLTPVGRHRLGELARIIRAIRGLMHLPLVELAAYTERILGLDIEVAAIGGVSARSRLDAFSDVVSSYQNTVESPSMGGFLAWLEAAERREDGLELPVLEPDPAAVQVATIHAAKGLEWDVVAVPGLVDGAFPSVAAAGTTGPRDKGWLTALDSLPYPVRGDRADLPVLDPAAAVSWKDLEARLEGFIGDNGKMQVSEERRLAYVAFTRARRILYLSAAWWDTSTKPRRLSPFLTELVEEELAEVLVWADEPTGENPFTADPRQAQWPADPFDADPTTASSGTRRRIARQTADLVRQALAASRQPDNQRLQLNLDDPEVELVERLLAEDASRREPSRSTQLPATLSASAVVRLAADKAQFALDLRRPVPVEPSLTSRRGTSFHAWVEAYYGRATLVDLDAISGADDAPIDASAVRLREAFLESVWAARQPLAVETDVELVVEGMTVRARLDAVFADEDAADPQAVIVVDWKTGPVPTDAQSRQARDMQLAVYRLAWAQHTGLRPDQVSAAFHHVFANRTVTPTRLASATELAELLQTAAGDQEERLLSG